MSHHLRGDQQWSCECFTIAHWKLVTKPMLFRLGFFKASRTTIFTTLMRQTYFFVLHPIRLPDLPRSRTCTVLVASFKAESDLLWQQRWKYHIALKMSIVYQLIIKKKEEKLGQQVTFWQVKNIKLILLSPIAMRVLQFLDQGTIGTQ